MPVAEYEAAIDTALEELVEGEKAWATLSLGERRQLLDEMGRLVVEHGQEWVDAAVRIKQLEPSSPLVGEEWISGPYAVATWIAALSATLAKLEAGKCPFDDAALGAAPGGRVSVKALPHNIFDRLLLSGFSAEVWLQRGVSRADAIGSAGLAQRDPSHTRGVGAVLGAGNIFSIAPLDTLYVLFANNRVVALKLNPITDPLHVVWSKVLQPFISAGVVRVLTGAADAGGYLVRHKLVDHVHMTGSADTHDAIVFGTGAEGARRKAANEPMLDKEITSELGGVSPTIVLPGKWTKADIEFQANHVATQRLHNNGYNCIAGQVVLLSSKWPQRKEFLSALRKAVTAAPPRPAYYPGSEDRVAGACTSYPESERLGARVLVVKPEDPTALRCTEYFSPVLGVIEIDDDGQGFAERAVRMANEDFVGTLGVNVIAHPDTITAMGSSFDGMVEGLRYGTVAVNAWTGVGYLTPHATWGAFPGHTLDDVQSGIGVVHNAFLLDKTERTVVRGPFRPMPRSLFNRELSISPKPPWFVDNRTAARTGKLLVGFAGKPSWLKLPRIFASALGG